MVSEAQRAGETSISDQVVATIAATAAKEVEGVARLGTSSIRRTIAERFGAESRARGVGVEAGKKEAVVDLTFTVYYGYSIPRIIDEVRNRVAEKVKELAGLDAREININIADIEFQQEQKQSAVA